MSKKAKALRVVEVREATYAGPEQLHDALARELNFPSYYGCNLSALNDCLGDISTPTRIVVVRDGASEWFGGFCMVFVQAALENPALDLRIEDDRA